MNPSDFWYPWYPQLYADHAIKLNLEQDAIYRRMIDRYMLRREPLPSDSQAIANICMISLEKWEEHSSVVLQFFKKKKNLLYSKRCDTELDRQDSLSKKMSDNAKKAQKNRHKNQTHSSCGSSDADIQDKTGQDKTGSIPPSPPSGGIVVLTKGERHGRRKESGTSEGKRIADKILMEA